MECFGPFRLDRHARRLWRDENEVSLTPKALELLLYFLEHAGQVLSREHLLEHLWPGTFVDDHALSVQIGDLRRALGDDKRESKYIETRHRQGYCFKAGVQSICAPAPVAEHPPETRYARSGETNIAYQVIGEGPVDLVFVMGWVSHLEYFWTEPSFARFLRRLATFSRVILFDKRGTGLSDHVPLHQLPTIEQRMYDLRAVMDAVGSKRAVLCGVSEGGPMSAVFAATYPGHTLALIMIGTYAKRLRSADYPWGPTAEQREQFIDEIRNHWGGPVGLEDRAPSLARDPRFREWWSAYLRMGASPGAAVALTRMNGEIDVRNVLPAVRVPTLVIHRAGDRCLVREEGQYVASLIPGARYVELPGEDHLPFVGDQEQILGEVEQFVARVRHTLDHDRVLATVLKLEFRDASSDLLQTLAAQARNEVKWFRGLSASVKGPQVLATFDGPARAVRCACQLRGYAAERQAQLRAGLHTGECDLPLDPPASGPAVETAAAIQSRASMGEILASSTVRDLVAGSGLQFESTGKLLCSGQEWNLFRVQGPIL